MKKTIHEIIILDGVEDYLTDSAKKYKRNLMLVGFILVSLFFLNFTEKGINNIELTSAFGFGFKSNESNVGVDTKVLSIILSVICAYEMLMLCIYKKQCDSHYFGQQISKNNKDGEAEELNYFKRKFSIVSQESTIKHDVNVLIEKYLKLEKMRNEGFRNLVEPNSFEENCSARLKEINEKNHNQNNVLIANLVNEVMHYFKTRTKPSKSLTEEQLISLEKIVLSKIKEIQITPKTQYEFIIESFFKDYRQLYQSEKQLLQYNEEWKVYIEEQIQQSINLHEELLARIKGVGAPSRWVVLTEIYIPLIWGGISIILGLITFIK